jgi:hypothetical protein
VGTIELTGARADQFSIVADDCSGETVAPGDACEVDLRFAPTKGGSTAAYLQIPSNAGGSPSEVKLTGTGVAGPVATVSPTSIDFGTKVAGGKTLSKQVTVRNSGDAPLDIDKAELAGGDADQFEIVGDACSGETLAPGAKCAVKVRFTPTSGGDKTANLTITSNAANSPSTVSVSGTGRALTVNRSAVNFGSVAVGAKSTLAKITVTNVGTTDVTLESLPISGSDASQFQAPGNFNACIGQTLKAGEKCVVRVRFVPKSAGTKSATLTVVSDVGGPGPEVALTGEGMDA